MIIKNCSICNKMACDGYVTLGRAPYTRLAMSGRNILAYGDNEAVYVANFCPECGTDLREENEK